MCCSKSRGMVIRCSSRTDSDDVKSQSAELFQVEAKVQRFAMWNVQPFPNSRIRQWLKARGVRWRVVTGGGLSELASWLKLPSKSLRLPVTDWTFSAKTQKSLWDSKFSLEHLHRCQTAGHSSHRTMQRPAYSRLSLRTQTAYLLEAASSGMGERTELTFLAGAVCIPTYTHGARRPTNLYERRWIARDQLFEQLTYNDGQRWRC